MGIYEQNYKLTEEYHNLLSLPQLWESHFARLSRLSNCARPFRPRVTTASVLKSPALWIVHPLFGGTITGRNPYTYNITTIEFQYLLSMIDKTPYHLGFIIANSFHHQATDTRSIPSSPVRTLQDSLAEWIFWEIWSTYLSPVDLAPSLSVAYRRWVLLLHNQPWLPIVPMWMYPCSQWSILTFNGLGKAYNTLQTIVHPSCSTYRWFSSWEHSILIT